MRAVRRGLGWLMMAVGGLVLFVSVLAVLEHFGWPSSEGVEPMVIATMVAVIGTGAALGALGAYLAFSWRGAD